MTCWRRELGEWMPHRRGGRGNFAATCTRPARIAAQYFVVAAAALGAAAGARGDSLWEFDPYRIELIVATATRPELGPDFAARLGKQLLDRADAYVGAAWAMEVNEAIGPLAPRMVRQLDSVTEEELPESARAKDKVVLFAIDYTAGQYRLALREWDALTRQWQHPVARRVPQASMLADEAFRALVSAFAPIAEVEAVDDKRIKLRWKAGALPARDPNVKLTPEGTVLRPFLRTLDREGNTRKVQAVDWTFLVAGKSEGGHGEATLYSGLRGALSEKRRGRVQPLALAARYRPGPTQLELRARTEDARPLPDYEVYAYGPDDPKTVLVGHTDRQGQIEIPSGGGPLRLLLIKDGTELLARVPMVPGLLPKATLRLADDAPRLAAEAFIVGLQERLVDAVVRRNVLIARMKLRLSDGRVDEAVKLMEELRRLDSQQQFLLALDQQQQKAVSSDPYVQRKIDRMFADARKLVGQYLDPREVSRMEIEVDAARQAQGAQPAKTAAN